jgi:hypothetical protein
MLARLVILAAICAILAPLSMRAQSKDPQLHKGTVVSASATRLVMKDTGGREHSFPIEAGTKVTINGKPGNVEDLKTMMPVQVATDAMGKVLTVSTMDREKSRSLVASERDAQPAGSWARSDRGRTVAIEGENEAP